MRYIIKKKKKKKTTEKHFQWCQGLIYENKHTFRMYIAGRKKIFKNIFQIYQLENANGKEISISTLTDLFCVFRNNSLPWD